VIIKSPADIVGNLTIRAYLPDKAHANHYRR
jgi:hypothetical protein